MVCPLYLKPSDAELVAVGDDGVEVDCDEDGAITLLVGVMLDCLRYMRSIKYRYNNHYNSTT